MVVGTVGGVSVGGGAWPEAKGMCVINSSGKY